MKNIFKWCLFLFPIILLGQIRDPLLVYKDNKFDEKLFQNDQTQWVDSIYNSLSLKEKIGQLFMPMVFSKNDSVHFNEIMDLVKNKNVGGLIFSLGGPVKQTNWLNDFQSKAKTPLIIAMDAEWGVAMRLDSIMPYPWPMTLGAIKDTTLLRSIGRRMGEQEKRLGVHYSFSPVLDINTNANNPIIGNRSYGSSKERVTRQALAIMKGHHEAGVLTSGKHFPGHGDTALDSHKTLPTVKFTKKHILEIELAPYRELINRGLSSIMVAHLNIPSITETGLPTSLSKDVIQDLLKKELGFKGLIVTDALNMKGVSEYSKVENIDLKAFLAGHDLLLISANIPSGILAIKKAYNNKKVSEERLAFSVKKILRAKYKVGLANYKPIKTKSLITDLNTIYDEVLYTQAIGKSLTLLKNSNNLLPLKDKSRIAHISLGDDTSDAFQNQLKNYQKVSLLKGITAVNVLDRTQEYDTIITSFHRSNSNPWKESGLNAEQKIIIKKLASSKTLILDLFVKPYALKGLEGINGINALLMSYQNSVISQKISVDAIFGAHKIEGSLPVDVSISFKEGDGININGGFRLGFASASELGFDEKKLQAIDKLAFNAIDSMMTPGMQIIVARKGKKVYEKNFGHHTYKKKQSVRSTDIYDLASITKIAGTLPLVMQAFDKGELTLETTISDLLPDWKNSNKANLTIKEMLSHYSRLWPWIPFYKSTLNRKGHLKKSFYKKNSSKKYALPVAKELFLKSNFEEYMYQQIKESKLIDSLEYKYSDLPYYIFKKYFESKTNNNFNQLVKNEVIDPLGLNTIIYNPLQKFNINQIVPTEIDTYFRNRILEGYVHDMGAAMQGGVGGHAGLFGNANDVAAIMQMYLQKGYYNGVQLISPETISVFNTCYFCNKGNRRGLGFDKPQIDGFHKSTCGCVSNLSFGHSGYTGTYAWADPEKEIIVVILSNRSYPNDDFTFSKNNIRTRIQELVYESLIN